MNFHGKTRFCPECKSIQPTEGFEPQDQTAQYPRLVCANCAARIADEIEDEKVAA